MIIRILPLILLTILSSCAIRQPVLKMQAIPKIINPDIEENKTNISKLNREIERRIKLTLQLKKETERIAGKLKKMKTNFVEFNLKEGDKPTIIFAVEGVEFKNRIDPKTNKPIYKANLTLEPKLFYIRHQEDENPLQIFPVPGGKEKIKIDNINRLIDITKDDYQRLVTFLILINPGFKLKTKKGESIMREGLIPGSYKLEVRLVDENSGQITEIKPIFFQVLPKEEKNE